MPTQVNIQELEEVWEFPDDATPEQIKETVSRKLDQIRLEEATPFARHTFPEAFAEPDSLAPVKSESGGDTPPPEATPLLEGMGRAMSNAPTTAFEQTDVDSPQPERRWMDNPLDPQGERIPFREDSRSLAADIGYTPENIPSGADVQRELGLPKAAQAITVPLVSIDRAIAGMADFLTSPSGMFQTAALAVPVVGTIQAGKFTYDMFRGAVESAHDLGKALTEDEKDAQRISDDIVNIVAGAWMAKKTGEHTLNSVGKYVEQVKATGTPPAKPVLDAFPEGVPDWLNPKTEVASPILKELAPATARAVEDNAAISETLQQKENRELKDADLKKSVEDGLKPEQVTISVQGAGDTPGAAFVQVDVPVDVVKPKIGDTTSTNAEKLNELGVKMPTTEELKKLPQGKYTISEAQRLLSEQSSSKIQGAVQPEVGKPVTLTGEQKPAPALESEMAGPGGTVTSDIGVSTSELTQLAKSAPKVSGSPKSQVGQSAIELLKGAAEATKSFAAKVKEFLVSEPKWGEYDSVLGKWQALRQESSRDAYFAWKDFKAKMPDQNRRSAIAAWVDAGGDRAVMERAASELPSKYASIYKKALALTPEEIIFAKNIRSYFDKRLQDAQDAGILENGLENYIRRIYEKDSDWKSAKMAELQRLSTSIPSFARQRFFEYDADAIKAGQKPVMDFAGRVLEYDQALNHAIADRAFVKSLMQLKQPDGRPMIDVAGSGKLLPEGDVPKEAILIKPQAKTNSDLPIDNRSDYRPFNHPAFRKYKWITKDSAGKDVFVQGDVIVHPDALPKMQRLLEASKIRQHPIGRGVLNVSSTVKQTMLDLSLFHPVQIGVHGLEHRIVPLRLTEIDLKQPTQRALVEHGLIVAEDRGFNDWSEGLHGTSLTRHIPKIGPKLQDFHNWMFKEWIPAIKMNMALHALERNQKRYPKLNQDQLLRLTAEQGNAAFGGLNYRMLGRSQTMQDFLRLTFLAPDFLEARGRFAGQAMKGYGREQFTALMLGAATLYVTARIINQIVDDNAHWEKENTFSIVLGDHAYGLRTVQGDLLHLMSKPGQFWYHRLNPVTTRPLMEVISGRDYFGRKVGIGDVMLDEIKTVTPISLRGLVEGKEQSVLESALNAMGVTTRRYNSITQAYGLAREWREKSNTRPEPGEFIYDPEKDPLRDLKLALQHEHTPDAVKEIAELVERAGYTSRELMQHFKRYANAPIAGSKKNQRVFMESLRPDQREIVDMAQERKGMVLKQFEDALFLYNQIHGESIEVPAYQP